MKTTAAAFALATIFTTAMLGGCVSSAPPLVTPPLVCIGEEQCKLYWERAQVWVAQNSSWKIQVATSVLIQTYNAADGSSYNHYSLMREPLESGTEVITMTTGCDNIFGCAVRADVARRSLYEFVTSEKVSSS